MTWSFQAAQLSHVGTLNDCPSRGDQWVSQLESGARNVGTLNDCPSRGDEDAEHIGGWLRVTPETVTLAL